MTTASEIQIKAYRKILIWPLRHVETNHKTKVAPDNALIGLGKDAKVWKEISDPLKHLSPTCSTEAVYDRDEYAEYVFFHPFIQRFLFPDPRECPVEERPMRVYSSEAVDRLRLKKGPVERELNIERLRFYTFTGNVSLFVMELTDTDMLASGAPQAAMSFAEMQVINSSVRHCYAPYYFDDKTSEETVCGIAGEVAENITYLKKGAYVSDGMLSEAAAVSGLSDGLRQPEMLPGLKKLLPELHNDYAWRMTVDNRMPSMTFVAIDDPLNLRETDFQRLVFHEDVSDKVVAPYGSASSSALIEASELDLQWAPEAGKKTRYCFAPTGMVMLTDSSDFALQTLGMHFRRHYFQMGLIAQMQHATLLALSDQLSTALDDVGQKNKDLREARKKSHDILNQVLRFSHRYWFPEISNQMQPRMMFAKWHESLGVQRLYETVMRESREANDFLSRSEEQRIAENSGRLNKIAMIGVVFGVATGLLGSNSFQKPNEIYELGKWVLAMPVIGWTGIAFGLFVALLAGVDRLKTGRRMSEVALLAVIAVCFMILAGVGFGSDFEWFRVWFGLSEGKS